MIRNLYSHVIGVGLFTLLVGCGEPRRQAEKAQANIQKGEKPMSEVVKKIRVPDFDPEGDPEIRVLGNGALEVRFEFMPPSFAPEDGTADLGRYKDFDKRMAAALGTEVLWEDRERFIIRAPKDDTVARIQEFLKAERKRRP